ncbi:hypothetical protein Hypma_012130 [Hypsizygus marmoreus]|uniref:Protein LURP-one-related 15 n=1 Tax=Hypsizygus marmoreus TaxID=39966 RepID=A0A369JH23_HYPMA|nr:hypothetical protein Hypma_012130 [Hypsizygus marmoreus]
MPRLTFHGKDILDSIIRSEDNTTHYYTSTTTSFRGRKITSIQYDPPHSLSAGYTAGTIDWRTGVFDIGGLQRPISMLKRKSGGLFSSEREWTWSGEKYIIKFGGDRWTATRRSDNETCAVFTMRESHTLRDSKSATITFPVTIPAEDVLFLMMVMIYSVTRHEDKRKQSQNAHRSNAANAASAANTGTAEAASLAVSTC